MARTVEDTVAATEGSVLVFLPGVGEIEAVRGVRCEYAVGQLQKLGLVQTVGHRDTVGRPALLGTTDAFLRRFGLHSLAELPEYERFAGLADGEALEDADQSAMG